MIHLRTILVAVALASSLCRADDFVDWTSAKGSTIRAKFVSEEGGQVTLLKQDGRKIEIRMDQLSAKSRQLVGELTKAKSAPTAPDSSSRYQVKTLSDVPWKGRHAVYDREKFVAVADVRGNVRVYMKKDGEALRSAPSLRLWPSLLYYPADFVAFRDIVEVTSDAEPTRSPKKLSFSGKTKTGTTFEVTYVFEGDTIAAYGHLRDPSGIEHPTLLRLGMRFPKHEKIKFEMSASEKRALVGDSSLKAVTKDGADIEFDYLVEENLNAHAKVKEGLESVTVKPAISGPHTVKFTAPDRKYGTLRIWNASSKPPYEGFGVSVYRKDPTDRSSKARILLEIK